jgi:hypothetical protein
MLFIVGSLCSTVYALLFSLVYHNAVNSGYTFLVGKLFICSPVSSFPHVPQCTMLLMVGSLCSTVYALLFLSCTTMLLMVGSLCSTIAPHRILLYICLTVPYRTIPQPYHSVKLYTVPYTVLAQHCTVHRTGTVPCTVLAPYWHDTVHRTGTTLTTILYYLLWAVCALLFKRSPVSVVYHSAACSG